MNNLLKKVALLTAGLTVGGVLLNANPAKAEVKTYEFKYDFAPAAGSGDLLQLGGMIEGTFDGTLAADGNTITGVTNLDATYTGELPLAGDDGPQSIELMFDTVKTGIVTIDGAPITFLGSGNEGSLGGEALSGLNEFSLTDGGQSFVSNQNIDVLDQEGFNAASWSVEEAGDGGGGGGVVPEPGTVTALALFGATAVATRLKKSK